MKNTVYVEKDGIKYCKSNGRMMYNEEYHDRHGEYWTEEEIGYLCTMRAMGEKYIQIGLGLGRTPGTCCDKYHTIKHQGKIDYYINKYKEGDCDAI